jgi:hypothetical protein
MLQNICMHLMHTTDLRPNAYARDSMKKVFVQTRCEGKIYYSRICSQLLLARLQVPGREIQGRYRKLFELRAVLELRG